MTPSDDAARLDPFADLLDVLDLDELGTAHISVEGLPGDAETDLGESRAQVFVGRSQPQPHGRVFGGQVLAQSVIAAGRTMTDVAGGDRGIHSLHAYFVRPGDANHPIRFAVERMRDGNSFSTRRVHAIQYGKTILSMIASFQDAAEGMDHQDLMPAAPDPETLPHVEETLGTVDHPAAQFFAYQRPVDLRHVEGHDLPAPGRPASSAAVGVAQDGRRDARGPAAARGRARLRLGLLPARARPAQARAGLVRPPPAPGQPGPRDVVPSPGRADEWILYTQSSPSASGGRGLAAGRMFAPDGTLIASVAQEGMLRLKES